MTLFDLEYASEKNKENEGPDLPDGRPGRVGVGQHKVFHFPCGPMMAQKRAHKAFRFPRGAAV